jgi:hypothetical protein
MSKPTAVPVCPDADDAPVTPEVEAELRRRLETFDEDATAARLWQDVLADRSISAAAMTSSPKTSRHSSKPLLDLSAVDARS